MMRNLLFIIVASFLASFQVVSGQSLVTDRPDFTESAIVVPEGTVQIESGVTITSSSSVRETTAPELLVRWGFSQRLELRVQSPDVTVANGSSGVGDPSIGLKIEFDPVRTWSIAAIAVTSVPLGETGFGSKRFEPLAIVAIGSEIGPVSLGTQVEGTWVGGSESALFGGTFVLGTSLQDGIGTFIEAALSQEAAGPAALILHSGVTLAVARLVQLDIHFGTGLTDTAPDVLVGLGLSFRR